MICAACRMESSAWQDTLQKLRLVPLKRINGSVFGSSSNAFRSDSDSATTMAAAYAEGARFRMQNMTKEDYAAVEDALERMGITELANRCVDELSGGQRQRVWIALALAQETDILLLDEPTTYLDIAYQVEILDLLTELNRRKGTTIVMILHDVNLSARYADHLFALCRGKLIAEGKPADVITEELMQKVYQLNCIVMKDPLSGAPLIVPKGKYC